jgi:response regulator RpfG family c-di-GMP phosphodiesterase
MTDGHRTSPARVLVVEDDMMIAMMLRDELTRLGYQVVGPASRIERALRLAETETIEAALLDINVAGEKVDRVAERLSLRRIPFAFVSGYNETWIPKAYADRPRLEKPFQVRDLKRVLDKALATAAARPGA